MAPIAGAAIGGAIGGGAVAAATGLGGVGLAYGGSAVGIGALTAVAAPAVVVGTVVGTLGYMAATVVRGRNRWNRQQTLRQLVMHFFDNGQLDKAIRIFEIEGKGELLEDRQTPRNGSAKALLDILEKSESSASVGLFCSPVGQIVATFDLDDGRYAYVILVNDDEFIGGGIESRGGAFDLTNCNSVDHVIERLEREGFLRFPDNSEEESE